MGRARLTLSVAFVLGTLQAGCGSSSPTPPSPSPSPSPGDGIVQITGKERLGWDQPAASAADVATLKFALYVDEAASTLSDASCDSTSTGPTFACAATLPPLTPGEHTLQLTAFVDIPERLESERSAPVRVSVARPASAEVPAAILPTREVSTRDGIRLRVETLLEGLVDPVDMTIAPEGRLFIGERGGRVHRLVDNADHSRLIQLPALRLTSQPIVALATDPDFVQSQWLYVVERTDDGPRLTRARETATMPTEHIVLLDRLEEAGSGEMASLRFGPDAKLYLALDTPEGSDAGADLGSFAGKVLRLNADATTPADQPGLTPVHALDVVGPRGLDWDTSGALWLLERDDRLIQRLRLLHSSAGARAITVATHDLPPDVDATSLAVFRSPSIPALRDDVFVTDDRSGGLLRLRFNGEGTLLGDGEPLLTGSLDGARAVAVAQNGTIYVCTATRLLRLSPVRE